MNLYHTGLSELYKRIEVLGDPLTGDVLPLSFGHL